jgi:cell division FtsZ-interacting protein ZapD
MPKKPESTISPAAARAPAEAATLMQRPCDAIKARQREVESIARELRGIENDLFSKLKIAHDKGHANLHEALEYSGRRKVNVEGIGELTAQRRDLHERLRTLAEANDTDRKALNALVQKFGILRVNELTAALTVRISDDAT